MISVIVPIYKVEKYLDRCLKSIVNQTYKDLEIILVDDGSPDKCPKLCDIWASKDSRIKVIHKKNEGQGKARNSGLQVAQGQWVSFIDSDDYIDINMYKECIKKLEETRADICYYGYKRVHKNGNIQEKKMNFPSTLNKKEIYKELLPKCFGRFNNDLYKITGAWSGLFSRELLVKEKIKFVSEQLLISEDYVFNAEICCRADKITFINKCYYYYCENTVSTTYRYLNDRFQRIIDFYENRSNRIKELNLSNEALLRAQVRFWEGTIDCLKKEIKNNDLSKDKKLKRIDEVCNSEISKKLNNKKIYPYMNIRQRIMLNMIKHKNKIGIYTIARLKK